MEYEPPGTVRYYDENSGAPVSTALLSHPYNSIVPNAELQFTSTTVRCSVLGTNIYANPQQAQQAAVNTQQQPQPQQATAPVAPESPAKNPQQQFEDIKEPSPLKPSIPIPAPEPSFEKLVAAPAEPATPPKPKLNAKEFNFLAKLMGVGANQQNTFKFSLGMDNL